MKKSIFLLLLICGFTTLSKADTIDVWQVYYNGIKLSEFNELGKTEVKLKLKDVKVGDSITIKYINDHPCSGCIRSLYINDQTKKLIIKEFAQGSNDFSFRLDELVKAKNKSTIGIFEVFYFQIPIDREPFIEKVKPKSDWKPPVFKIIIE